MKLCPQGIHTLVDGRKRCVQCQARASHNSWEREKRREEWARVLAEVFEPLRPTFNWRKHAKCVNRQEIETLFFPRSPSDKGVAYGRAICAGCPVRRECLDDALSYPDTKGLRGGYVLPFEITEVY